MNFKKESKLAALAVVGLYTMFILLAAVTSRYGFIAQEEVQVQVDEAVFTTGVRIAESCINTGYWILSVPVDGEMQDFLFRCYPSKGGNGI